MMEQLWRDRLRPVALFPLLNGILAATIEALKPYEVHLPGWVFLVLNGALAVVTAITALVTRILAVPGVNHGYANTASSSGSRQKTQRSRYRFWARSAPHSHG